jgi:ribose 5-phosphate isomerase A
MTATASAAAERALEFVEDGARLGLGTGRAATAFVQALGVRVKAGLRVQGVPTSETTAALARELGIPLVTLEQAGALDLTVDGADEVDPNLDVIKGYGGALVREKIVAASGRRLIILVGKEKLVSTLGARGKLPVEIVPFAETLCHRRLSELGCRPTRRLVDGEPFVTDNGNYILDCGIEPIADPVTFEHELLAVPGVVGTGLFLGMATAVIVEDGGRADVRRRGG